MKKIVLFIFLGLISCKNSIKQQRNSGGVFGTTYSIIYDSNEDFQEEFEQIFNDINHSMSTYIPNSIISEVNNNRTIKIDSHFKRVFETSKQVFDETNGRFDPTIGAVVNAWDFGPEGKIEQLDSVIIKDLMQSVGLNKVSVEGFLITKPSATKIDFNAIAKGYTVDALATMLSSLGYENYLVEVGGELFAAGINPEKEIPWRVAIDHPEQRETRAFIATLPLQNQGLASSGNYRKFRTDEQGTNYVHTINPKTGKTVKSNVLSTSVLAPSTMLADAYATALMVMPFEIGKNLIESLADVDALWVLAEKDSVRVDATKGFTFDLQ